MKYAYKAMFVMLALILCFTTSFGNKIINMRFHPFTHYLTISHDVSHNGTTIIKPGEHLYLNFNDGRIVSLLIIAKHGGNIFTTPIPPQSDVPLDLIVKPQDDNDWYYSIKIWISPTKWYIYDPKIAVKSVKSPMITWVIGFASAFLVTLITSVVFYRKWKQAEILLQNGRVQK